jgi:hypothetical protein
MTAKQLLEFGWSVFRNAAGKKFEADAEDAFGRYFAQQSSDLAGLFERDGSFAAETLGLLANFLVQSGRDAALCSAEYGEISATTVTRILAGRKQLSGTTFC